MQNGSLMITSDVNFSRIPADRPEYDKVRLESTHIPLKTNANSLPVLDQTFIDGHDFDSALEDTPASSHTFVGADGVDVNVGDKVSITWPAENNTCYEAEVTDINPDKGGVGLYDVVH